MKHLTVDILSAAPRSISDDDLCSTCARCDYRPGDTSRCAEGWPTSSDASEYVLQCPSFAKAEHEAAITEELRILGFGMAPEAVKLGYGPIIELFEGTADQAKAKFQGQDVVLVTGAALAGSDDQFEFAVMGRLVDDALSQGVRS